MLKYYFQVYIYICILESQERIVICSKEWGQVLLSPYQSNKGLELGLFPLH